jgi:hypothetical protein
VDIFVDEEELGTLAIGRVSLTWFGKNSKIGRRFPW